MSSRKKSQYFRIMQAKKRKLEGNEKSVSTEKANKGQKSISVFFSAKPKPKPERSKETDAVLKRKLDLFKSCNEDKPGEIRQCRKMAKLDQDIQETACDLNEKVTEKSPKKKLTPLEQQVLEIQKNFPDTLLMVECGYRYRFFGSDAEKAGKILDIVAHPDNVGSGQLGNTSSTKNSRQIEVSYYFFELLTF